jgi:hypothetical protein
MPNPESLPFGTPGDIRGFSPNQHAADDLGWVIAYAGLFTGDW